MELGRFRAGLRLPDDAVGVAVYRGEQFQGLDLFDRHSTLVYFWESLLDSYAIDLLAEAVGPRHAVGVVAGATGDAPAGVGGDGHLGELPISGPGQRLAA